MYAQPSLGQADAWITVVSDARQEQSSQHGIEARHRTAWSQRDDIRHIEP